MNKNSMISVAALFVLTSLCGLLVHGTILAPEYTKLANIGVYRTPEQAQPLMGYMMAANLFLAIGLTWVYRMGRDGRPWAGQGLRFGLAIWVLTTVPTYLIYYVVTPLSSNLVAKQIVLDLFVMLVVGLVTAFLNRDSRPARA